MTTKYGVFKWSGDGRYPASKAKKTYTSKSLADKAADKLNNTSQVEGGYVVRGIYT